MQILKKWLIGNEKNLLGKGAFWNIISSVEYSVQSAILVLIITRTNGLYDAGVFTIAYTLTQMMATIGSYGMRSFQASDIRREYSFSTYFLSRIMSVLTMIIICIIYALMQSYDVQKLILIVILCGYRVVDDIEDVFHGEMQKSMRLDIAAKIVSIRIFFATIIFGVVYIVTNNLVLASMSLTISSVMIAGFLNYIVADSFENIIFKRSSISHTFKLLWVCLPICVGGFLYNYLVNAPKYAIDRVLSEETQTIFSILFMPIFVINILSSFIFKPMIVNMGIMWCNKEKGRFMKIVAKQIALIVAMTVVIIIAGITIGIDILGWMYGVDLDIYRNLFALLILFGGIAAMVAFLVDVMTIIRKQKFIIVAYGIAVIIDTLMIDNIVYEYKIWGAGMIYGIAMGVVLLVMMLVLVTNILKRNGMKNDRDAEKNIS